ncbi:MAG: hypothetical protein JXB23_07750 [Candidatus Aminicenantes bacterium]|nr:hypothetical protein [Candidatus Aminicenantes bacterium]
MIDQRIDNKDTDREKPPILSSWNRLYAAVLLNLALLIGLFYLITKVFE